MKMSIRGVSGNIYSQNFFENKKIAKSLDEKNKNSDRVELSSQAKELHKAQLDSKMEEISNRISGGFYSQRSVTEKVAESILKDIYKEI
jgi:hypothetical protein